MRLARPETGWRLIAVRFELSVLHPSFSPTNRVPVVKRKSCQTTNLASQVRILPRPLPRPRSSMLPVTELPPLVRRAAAWFDSGRKHAVAYLTGVGGSSHNCRSRFDPGTRLNQGGGAHAMDGLRQLAW
jgi:hypothetical protein